MSSGRRLRRKLSQQVLVAQRRELELLRQSAAEFDHAVVRKGKATLDRMRHRHTVTLRGEQVRAKKGGDFQILGALQDAPIV